MNIRLEGSKEELNFAVSCLVQLKINFTFNGRFYENRRGFGYRIYLSNIDPLALKKISEDLQKVNREKRSNRFKAE